MRPFLLPAILLHMLLIASMSMAAEPASQETKAIAVIEQYGGKVRFDWKRPDRSVVFVEIENANFDDTALARLSALSEVRELHLHCFGITDAGLKHLAPMTRLRELDLSGTKVTDAGLDSLRGFADLQVLNVGGAYVTDDGLPRIEALRQLRGLSLALSNVSETGTAHLRALPRLESLDLGMTRVGDDGLEELEGMTGLRELGLCNANITDIGMASLKGLTRLQVLSLAGNKITDAGLTQLKGLTQLETLDLQSNKITDVGLIQLKGLTRLKNLDLQGNKISNAGMAQLKALTQLETLDLRSNKITDAGIEHRAAPLFQGKFTIGGAVVDQDGKPLSGVKVRIEKSEGVLLDSHLLMYREERLAVAQHTLDSSFEFKVNGGAALYLTFKKAGYDPVDDQMIVIPAPERTDTAEVLANRPVAQPVVEKRNLRIVMDKQGQLVRLQSYFAGLEFSVDGSGVGLDLDRPERSLLADSPAHKVSKFMDSRQLPANCICLLADLDKSGRIAMETAKFVRGDEKPQDRKLPATVRLVASGTDSGFIVTAPPDASHPFRKMKEAPVQGYQREIVFRASDLGRQSSFVFYFRVNGKFGKGQIFDIWPSGQEGARLTANLDVRLQPDGSRNLESMQCW